MTRASIGGFALIMASFAFLSCGASPSSSNQPKVSGLNFRAFVSQDVTVGTSTAFPGGVAAGLFIIDANKDVRSSFISSSNLPGLLAEAPNKKVTLAYGVSDNTVAIINNASESSTTKPLTLPGPTESIAISPDASTGYAAVPNAAVLGQSPGAIEVMNLSSASIATTIPVQSARYVVQSHSGNRLLVLSDNSNTITLIATSNVAACTPICVPPGVPPCPPRDPLAVSCQISGFDHPVWAVFSSDDNAAYVLNCGAQCGGQTASVQALDMTTQSLLGAAVAVDAATIGLLNGNYLYVAGTPPPPANACPGTTAATTCGRLDVVNLSSMPMTVTNSQVITDGYHNRIDLSENGQLFIGARTCTNVSSTEVRGCLSIFNTISSAVVIPPLTGDVTGLQAITNRNVEYVVQGGELRIFDTTTDKLGPTQIDLSGQIIDVKLVDF